MLTTSTRPHTDLELDLYSDMMDGRVSLPLSLAVAAVLGALIAAGAYGVHWVYAWITSGTPTWAIPLTIGGVVAVIGFFALRSGGGDDAWTRNPPGLATDVTATADAAWLVDDDSLAYRFIFRVEPDRFIVVNQGTDDPEREGLSVTSERVGSEVTLVLLGEGPFRRVIDSKISGPPLELRSVEIPPSDDWSSSPEGIYDLAHLPTALRTLVAAR